MNTVSFRRGLYSIMAVILLFAIMPAIIGLFGLSVGLVTEVMIFALFALAYNLLLGHTGLASFGHAAFFGLGAYAVGILQYQGISNLWLGLLGALGAGLIAAGLVGWLVKNKRGIYFSILTLAIGQIFYIVAMRWDEVTGGEGGLTGLERPELNILNIGSFDLNEPLAFYYFVLFFLAVGMIAMWRLTKSPFGMVLATIKGNEVRSKYLGYRTDLYKWAIFTISGAFTGFAGGLFGMLHYAAYPQYVYWVESGNVVIATLLGGGLVSFLGPILGAAVFVGMQEVISSVTEYWMFYFGLLFILVVMSFPNGLPSAFGALAARVRRRGAVRYEGGRS